MESSFEKFEIVKYLQKNAPSLFAKTQILYKTCENILGSIPKEFSNYTKHDIHHSIRVIGYMNDLVKSNLKNFSNLHLALIIYAGLLHDTGMFVSDREKKRLFSEFAIQNPSFCSMTDEEKTIYLQDYIRENHGKRVKNVIEEKFNEDTKLKSILYYDEAEQEFYIILSQICQAHMEESEWISKNLRDHEYFGDDIINPRHIAVLLRIGDMLDIDKNRAPYVLYSMLQPEGYSDTEWRKHAPITNFKKIIKKDDKYFIQFSGRTGNPEIYRKVEGYIDYCQKQLEKDIAICTGNYDLKIKLPITKDITTIGFKSTEFKFSMDYKQISKLLTGEQLYGSKKEGLRELLQNAIDAVKVMKEIEEKKPYSKYVPLIGVDIDKDKKKIVVFDNGIGMTEEVLHNYFFSIGNSYYVSKAFNKNAYSYQPIGHFGIGFLACFMLSSKITLETFHHESKKFIRMSFDKDSPFVIEYTTDGETFDLDHGTKIYMNYDEIIPEIFQDEEKIEKYIRELLIYNDFDVSIFNNGEKHIELRKPKYIYKKDDEVIEYECSLEMDRKGFIHDVQSFFKSSKDVYLVDDYFCDVISLNDFIQCFSTLSDQFQNTKNQTDKQDVLSKIYNNGSYRFPFFKQFLKENMNIILLSDTKEELSSICMNYLARYIIDDELVWYTVWYEQPRNISPASGETHLLSKEDIPYRYLDNIYNKLDLMYNIKINPVPPIREASKILRFDNHSSRFVPINSESTIYLDMYLKGIRVDGMRRIFSLPYTIKELNTSRFLCNFKTSHYETDVSRRMFDAKTIKGIGNKVACLIYGNVLNNTKFNEEEQKFVELFLKRYYGEAFDVYLQGNNIDREEINS